MFSLTEVAQIVDGTVEGDDSYQIQSLSDLASADETNITFYLGQSKDADTCRKSAAGAVILKAKHQSLTTGNKILVKDPYLAYAKLSQAMVAKKEQATKATIHSGSTVAPSARIGANVSIAAGAVIESEAVLGDGVIVGANAVIGTGAAIGKNTVVEDGALINAGVTIGRHCHIASGAVIGSSGFGYAPNGAQWVKIEQLGSVVIEDDVDIGANTTIDRGALSNTIIRRGVKIDNLVQIAHNVEVGEDTAMAAFVGIAGSAKIGRRCQLGGRVSIMGHIRLVDDVIVHTNTFVSKSIHKAGVYSAMLPAKPARLWLKTLAALNKLSKE